MLLVSNKYSKEKVVIEDSSPESTTRIRVEFDKGKLRKIEPKSAVLFMGGG
ncbi:MAG: hypothetical protein MOB07_04535 [Acidobacteria bacterium]|nr:hypothetical protein [Acidobacteriota bacterium]